MDLRSVGAVLSKHRTVTTLGVVLAFVLAFLAAFKGDFSSVPPTLERRQATTYESSARLFVTQKGFPWGRSTLRYNVSRGQPPVVEGDPDRFAQLALLYAQFANSDRVQGGLAPDDRGAVTASVVTVNQFSSDPLPMLDITAKAGSPDHARRLARRVTNAFLGFIYGNQSSSHIPVDQRVILQVIDPAQPGREVSGPSLAMPVLVLLTVLFATVGGVFAFDNWRSGRREVIVEVPTLQEPEDDATPVIAAAAGSPSRIGRPDSAPSTLGYRGAPRP